MKIIGLFFAFFLIMPFAHAEGRDEGIKEKKQHILKEMDEQIASIQKARNCITSSADHEAIKRCREAQESDRKHRKEEEIQEQITRLQEEKARLNHTK